jgi:tetratricopeptide (TPR) repeat protein
MRRELFICLFLIAITFVVFWQVQDHDFISFDDTYYVTKNRHVQTGLTLQGLVWAFTTHYAGNWHPLTWLSHMLDCQLFGLNPKGHHLTNLFLHIVNTVSLFLVFRWMTGSIWRSAFVAALFAFHPLHVESVAWVAERKDVLSTLFWILTMFAYLHYVQRSGTGRYLLILLCFALGLMAKPMLVTLPFTLLLLDYWPLGRFKTAWADGHWHTPIQSPVDSRQPVSLAIGLIWEKVPLLVLTSASCVVTFLVQKAGGAVQSLERFPFKVRIANALISYVKYMGKMVWPRDLAMLYPHQGNSVPIWQAVGASLLLLGITIMTIRSVKRKPYLAVGWLWYLGTLVPVIGLVQVGNQAMSDRYTYIPLIGLFIIITWGIHDLIKGRRYQQVVLTMLASILLTYFFTCTRLQLRHWKNSLALFEHTLNITANNYVIHNNMGLALSDQGRINEAINHYHKALRINPNDIYAHSNLGIALFNQEKTDEAIDHFRKALQIDPSIPEIYVLMGTALIKKEMIDKAIDYFRKALQLKPDITEAQYYLKKALTTLKKIDEAFAKTKEAVENNPDDPSLHYRLGRLYQQKGELDEAIDQYQKALSIQSEFPEALNSLAEVYVARGDYDMAVSVLKKMTTLWPNTPRTYYNLACIYARQNKTDESINQLEKAVNKGYNNWDLIKTDKDLDNIRDTLYYKNLMKDR